MTDNRLRVAMVSRASAALHGVGGLERHVDDLVRQLLECGVAVTLVTRPARRPADAVEADWLRDPGLTVRAIPYRTFPLAGRRGTTVLDRNTAYLWFGLRAGRCAARLVTEGQIDIVHGHGASVLGAVIAPPVRAVPLVFTPHGLEEFGGTDPSRAGLKRLAYRPLQAAVRRCARKASRIVATDRSLVSMTVRHLGVPPSRVRVLPNAVDVRRCDALAGPADGVRARSALNLADGEALILSVGRVERNKGFDLLAKALATLEERPGGSSWRWVLVGDGSTRSGLERLVTQLGLRHRVRFTGALGLEGPVSDRLSIDGYHPRRLDGLDLANSRRFLPRFAVSSPHMR